MHHCYCFNACNVRNLHWYYSSNKYIKNNQHLSLKHIKHQYCHYDDQKKNSEFLQLGRRKLVVYYFLSVENLTNRFCRMQMSKFSCQYRKDTSLVLSAVAQTLAKSKSKSKAVNFKLVMKLWIEHEHEHGSVYILFIWKTYFYK